ncbi:MBL fold metallo-hydrolase [Desulfoluna sp.]|uniref:MBL fold metallo-hydrolase n=1 Tax=Desulfoluna sp. TaxID=2045199 RepID=UPI0026295EFF|nr:MBL fold metallo-hydrolase [Desulfoluna sp.]
MKLTVLVDNSTYIDRYFLAEPAFSALIEVDGQKILFDCGYSDIFLRNAEKMGIDLLHLDHLVFSHGHVDHTGGLEPLMRTFFEAAIEGRSHRRPKVTAHPDVFTTRTIPGIGEIGSSVSAEKLGEHFSVNLSAGPVQLTERLWFLGEIPRENDFEAKSPLGMLKGEPDWILDDTALVWKGEAGLVVITGCSHAGICNIVAQAKRVCGEERILDIVGGLHLLAPTPRQLAGTLSSIQSLHLPALHACHCTDFSSRKALAEVAPQQEVGVGLVLDYD